MIKVVDLSYSVWETYLGNYFFGQTGLLTFGGEYNAWGALVNPPDSGVDLFWNVYTFSNLSSQPFTAEIWLNSVLPGNGIQSGNVACSNQAINPPPKPKVMLQYESNAAKPPSGGYFSFTRRVEPKNTLTRHDFQGMIIVPPGGSALTYLKSPVSGTIQSVIAFGWWEQKSEVSRELRGKIL